MDSSKKGFSICAYIKHYSTISSLWRWKFPDQDHLLPYGNCYNLKKAVYVA